MDEEHSIRKEPLYFLMDSFGVFLHYLTMRREETLRLLTGVNLTLNDLISPGWRRRLYTNGLVDPSMNPVLLLVRNV